MNSKLHREYLEGKWTLYDVLGHYMHRWEALPEWVVQALEEGFDDRLAGRRTLDDVFGLAPAPRKQLDKMARKLKYAPAVYWEVVRRSESGEPIDENMFKNIAADMKATFDQYQPDNYPPGWSTLRNWYQSEKQKRDPE